MMVTTRGSARRIATLVKTVLVDTIQPAEGAELRFRVEIFAWSEHDYSCQVWRYDTYRIQPTFQERSQVADEEWSVLDLVLDWRDLRAATAEQLLDLVFEEINRRFVVTIDVPPGPGSPPSSA
jgi:hypothetical protein